MRYHLDTQTWSGSATDLANHARCGHLTQLSRQQAREIAEGSAERDTATTLVMEKGKAHEAAYVEARRASGAELETQVWLEAGSLRGYADLLERGANGAWEPHEIKYARSVKPEHVLQALVYADALERRDGQLPELVHVVDGRGERHAYRTSEYFDYYRTARDEFAAALALDLDTELARVPDKVAHCDQCPFAAHCAARREQADHLSLVAWMRREQITKLAAADITTLTQLAQTELEHVPGIGRATLARHKAQARLQLAARTLPAAQTPIEYRQPATDEQPGRGFALLPEPDAADLFFDFEGYPFHEAGGLEYLWGWTHLDDAGAMQFDYLWASDPAEEAIALTRFLDLVHERLARAPGMHVYHYANYEIAALQRLVATHRHEQDRLDQLLRAGVFVDLFAVVRQAMLVGTPSYSIKQLEPIYGVTRDGADLADGGASIEVFERWLMDPDDAVKQTIIDYNRDDTDSTLALRNWLLEHASTAHAQGVEWPVKQHDDEDAPSDEANPEAEPEGLEPGVVEQLEAVADDEQRASDVRRVARLLSGMPGWDWRSRRQFFAELHARKHEREAEDYLDEPAALAGLAFVGEEPRPRGTMLRTYEFAPQVTIVSVGQIALDALTVNEVGEIVELDYDLHRITIKTTKGVQKRLDDSGYIGLPTEIVGWSKISVTPLEKAAKHVAGVLLEALDAGRDPFAPGAPHASALSILAGHATRAVSGTGPEALDQPPTPEQLVDLVQRAAGSHVIVQGPPGTGKTYTSARVIAGLVAAGLRVGISSNSHDAVINILAGLDEAFDGAVPFRVAYPLRTGEAAPGELEFGAGWLMRPAKNAGGAALANDGAVDVLAGTAWAFASFPDIDVMLVDEAGQVSLLHATAMAGAARRSVVLVGDPQQLPQPASVTHPEGLEASVLDHLFAGEKVLARERAALLNVTRRMHPRVTEFIGPTYYEGMLTSHVDTHVQYVAAPGLPRAGVHAELVEHTGNRVVSEGEVARIAELVTGMLADGRVVEKAGEAERAIEPRDIIVVAPYNAQRRRLQAALGPQIRVGTVDKFQGQEAPIAILSMTASSREDLPRGLEFLLNPHRLNVAISRARALAIVVTSPALVTTSAASIGEMRLLNDLARICRA